MVEHEFDIESFDLTEISPPDFARLIKDMPERQLAAIGTGPSRERIVDEILSRMATSFKPEVGGQLRAVIRWRILDTDQPEITFEMDIADQACRLTKGVAEPEPRLVLTMSTADFARLASGNATGTALFMKGRLKAAGDLGLAAGLASYFDIPVASHAL